MSGTALAGDVGALKICMDRLLPPLKTRPVNALNKGRERAQRWQLEMSSGQLVPEEAESLTATISTFIKTVEVGMFEDRLSALEKANAEGASREHKYDAWKASVHNNVLLFLSCFGFRAASGR
jgi:hypothetical protein